MRRVHAIALAVALGGLAAEPGPAVAGAAAACDPAPTAASEVARAKVVVIAKATARTRHLRDGTLRTPLAVVRVLRGELHDKTLTVDDCDDWKCSILQVARGTTVVLLLLPAEHHHWEPLGPHCTNGFQRGWLPYDPKDADVAAVLAATAAP